MTIEYEYYTGFTSDMEAYLKSSLSQYFDNNKWIKVGFTSNPEESWSKHKSDSPDWSKMIVIYKSIFVESVVKVTQILIDHAWERGVMADEIDGDKGNEGEQHVYFLIQK